MAEIRIQIANPPEEVNGVTWWRMFRPLQLLAAAHPEIKIRFNPGHLFPHDFLFCDILLVFRPVNLDHPRIIAQAKEHGCKVILDYDDDLLNIPVGYSMYKDTYVKRAAILESLALADVVWTSTDNLKDVCHKNVQDFVAQLRRSPQGLPPQYKVPKFVTVKNAVLPDDLPAGPNGNTKTALWRGSDFQRDDVDAYRSQYDQIVRNTKSFTWVGFMPTWGDVQRTDYRVDYNFGIKTLQWFEYMKAIKPSILWKPLVNNPFNQSKSNISWLEATAAGAVCVSNFAGTAPDWQYATKELPKLDETYAVLWRQSADHIKANYNLNDWNEIRYREILSLANE